LELARGWYATAATEAKAMSAKPTIRFPHT
jgi:hypothetical protein